MDTNTIIVVGGGMFMLAGLSFLFLRKRQAQNEDPGPSEIDSETAVSPQELAQHLPKG